ncbi:hypothetical protein O6H91_03G057700 [Diphasiastrum complanatum]|uniref:Uncharacterized protein n=1 Tax=Diphasiastrum complanatum TaxID=34168 RepID=A0ACC2E6I2_DIPCM|nr:hypothetical protein O6H91_03G057700 [Diphasiastrum complanatum]
MMLRRRKQQGSASAASEPVKPEADSHHSSTNERTTKTDINGLQEDKKTASLVPAQKPQRPLKKWGCMHTCCWLIGCLWIMWWTVLVLYNTLPSLPQYVTEAITGPLPDPPGMKLAKEGLQAHHPVVFVPGIVTGGLELWQGRPCADGLFRKRLWGGTFGEVYRRPLCWLEHMRLDNETGLDPPGIKVRPVSGLVAADYFAPGYFVWAVLIENLARLGYEEKSMHMAAYDWRLSFQNTEVRDKTLSRLKSTIELLVQTNDNRKVVVIPHSMGALYFLHFMKWVEAPPPMGGGGGSGWVARHIKAIMNIGGPFLGVPKAFAGIFSAEGKDIAIARQAVAPGVMDTELFGLQTLQHIMHVTRTWDATMSMFPKGGEVIWGDLDTSPEDGFDCSLKKERAEEISVCESQELNEKQLDLSGKPQTHYGRMVSFGKEAAEMESSKIVRKTLKDFNRGNLPVRANVSCGEVWTEYHEMRWEGVEAVVEGKIYTAETMLDLLRFLAPRMMERADSNWGYGVADDLDNPKYQHYKYWSNPLETKLPDAPEMEVYCMYGVGMLTERSYIYKPSSNNDTCYIPFRINASAEGSSEGCLKSGVYFVDGDETVPALSAGFMCSKGWRGKTRFNPSNVASYTREYDHAPPLTLLEGRGTQSGSHVDIMGNFALIEDILRVAAGATGEELGGDRIYSDLLKWSERIQIEL